MKEGKAIKGRKCYKIRGERKEGERCRRGVRKEC
jgi:hypothetical protein